MFSEGLRVADWVSVPVIEGISTFIMTARDVIWRCLWFWWSLQASTGCLAPSSRCHKISKVALIASSSLSQWCCFSGHLSVSESNSHRRIYWRSIRSAWSSTAPNSTSKVSISISKGLAGYGWQKLSWEANADFKASKAFWTFSSYWKVTFWKWLVNGAVTLANQIIKNWS